MYKNPDLKRASCAIIWKFVHWNEQINPIGNKMCHSCVYMCAHYLHACLRETQYYLHGSLARRRKRSKWYPELRHQTPETSWVMVHRSSARTKAAMVKRMKIVEERDRWGGQKTSSLGSAANSVWGLRLWGLCQSGSGGKVAPLRQRVESEWQRDARECVGH